MPSMADFHKKVTAGEITPGEDLRKQWPLIQERLGALRSQIVSFNGLSPARPARPARPSAQDKLFGALQEIGIHLEAVVHPPFTPRVLSLGDVAEMRRIEEAITGMKFGDRTPLGRAERECREGHCGGEARTGAPAS